MLFYVVLFYPIRILFYEFLFHVVLCYAMLCYAVLCYAMLCYAMLFDPIPWWAASPIYTCAGWNFGRIRGSSAKGSQNCIMFSYLGVGRWNGLGRRQVGYRRGQPEGVGVGKRTTNPPEARKLTASHEAHSPIRTPGVHRIQDSIPKMGFMEVQDLHDFGIFVVRAPPPAGRPGLGSLLGRVR